MPYLANIRLFTPTFFQQARILPRIDFKGKCPAVFQLSFSFLTDVLLLRSPWKSGLLSLLHMLKGFLDKKLFCFLPLTSVPVTAVVQSHVGGGTMWEEGIKVPDTPKFSSATVLRMNESVALKFLAAKFTLNSSYV